MAAMTINKQFINTVCVEIFAGRKNLPPALIGENFITIFLYCVPFCGETSLDRYRKGTFYGENLRGMLNFSIDGCGMPKISWRKIFKGGCKIAKFMKIFSLKSLPLYGN